MGSPNIAHRVKQLFQAARMSYPKVSPNIELPDPASYRLLHNFVGKI